MIKSLNTETRLRHIAIIGNPNSGKTTLFNALTGLRQKVGNYPGVTVEKKEGRIEFIDGSEAGTCSISRAHTASRQILPMKKLRPIFS